MILTPPPLTHTWFEFNWLLNLEMKDCSEEIRKIRNAHIIVTVNSLCIARCCAFSVYSPWKPQLKKLLDLYRSFLLSCLAQSSFQQMKGSILSCAKTRLENGTALLIERARVFYAFARSIFLTATVIHCKISSPRIIAGCHVLHIPF